MKNRMLLAANGMIIKNAKALRNEPTPAEAILWGYLTKGNQFGIKFRRQHPISNYIADFYCHSVGLVIEVDGSIHDLPEILQNDIDGNNI